MKLQLGKNLFLLGLNFCTALTSCTWYSSTQELTRSEQPTSSLASPQPSQTSPQSEESKDEQIDPALPEPVVGTVFQTIALRDQVPAAELSIRKAVVQLWPDGCLGLPKPDELCTQVITPGWEITVYRKDDEWVYRTDDTGTQARLAAGEPEIESVTPKP